MKKRLGKILICFGMIGLLTACGAKESQIKKAVNVKKESNANVMGNSSENINNEGMIAYQDGWYYYSNGKGIYKSKKSGKERKKIINEKGRDINVIGDWIYYMTDDGIRKIKTDGTEYTFVNSDGYNMIVVGNWIYYDIFDAGNKSGLHRIKTDGTEEELLVWAYRIKGINVDKKYIYYLGQADSDATEEGIYRVKLNGTGNELIYPMDIDDAYCDIVLKNKWIYFSDLEPKYGIYRIKTDGSKKECIYPFENESENPDKVAIFNDKIFWQSMIITENGETTNIDDETDEKEREDNSSEEEEDSWDEDDMDDDGSTTYDMTYKATLDGKNRMETGNEAIYDYFLNDTYIIMRDNHGNVKYELYDGNDKKISVLE